MRVAVILPAAGVGRRFAQNDPQRRRKLDLTLGGGDPVFLRAAALFAGRAEVAQVLLAVHPEGVDEFAARWRDRLTPLGIEVVPGGTRERWETVLRAMERIDGSCTHIAVHDAARPLATPALIDRVFAAALEHGAAIPATPVSNTLKQVDAQGRITRTVPRDRLVEAQTPQVFAAALLRRAYVPLADGTHDGSGVTDDASLVESLGEAVFVVEGEALNLKITTPADADLASAVLARRHV